MPLASGARRAPEPDGVDFTVSSSLPPMVAGSVSGEMELSVPYLYPKPGVLCSTRYLGDGQSEPMFVVRMQWWGDSGPGTVFKPGLLRGRDEDGERARRAQSSKATCALFPVRCALDGLLTYLTDMGSIVLDVLVHEGDPSGGARHAGRCVVPVGGSSWSGHGQGLRRESRVVAEGYFPVLSLRSGKYAGDLGVCLRACLGRSSKLRSVLAVAKMATAADESSPAGEGRKIADGGTPYVDRSGSTAARDEEADAGRRSGLGFRRSGEAYGGLPERASFDSADLTSGWSEAPPPADAVATDRLARDSAPLSSFQLNEALAKFDASDTLPIWPTPRGSLYRPPEALGQALSTPAIGQHQANRGRPARAGANIAGPRRKTSPTPKTVGGRVTRSPPTRVGVALTENTRVASVAGGAPSERKTRGFRPSVSPERQAPEPSAGTDLNRTSVSRGDDRGGARDELPAPPSHCAAPPSAAAAPVGSAAREDGGRGLSELLSRGKELRDKMALAAAAGPNDRAPPGSPGSPASPASSDLATLTAQPGLVSGAPLDSSLRDDIEGIFDTLSDAGQGVDVSVRDPETRGDESRVVDLLLSAAGPPPASLAFPALAAMERRRADSLARVRFLRIRLSRLVMFGSMTSAAEGHGWQLRFRLPAFAAPPGRGSTAAAGCRASVAQASKGGRSRNARVVSVPVPPRVSASTLGKAKAAAATVRRGRSTVTGTTAATSRSAASVLRVRRGFGACDLVVGETSLLEELVCAVDVDDTCVAQWMDTAVEFLLVDGKTDGAPRPRLPGAKNHPHLRKKQRSSTVGPGDRVAAVATFPLRDLVLSADLGVAATLDLIEVSDFWAAEDARAAAAGRTGRGGRPLRNPYRSDEGGGGGGARPLVLGDRAVGALAIALELVPGEPDVSPEHSRPEVERWTKGPRQQEGAAAAAAAPAAEAEGLEESAEEEDDGVLRAEASSAPPLPAGGVGTRRESSADGGGGACEGSEVGGGDSSTVAKPVGLAEECLSEEKHEPSGSLNASLPPDLEGDGGWKEASGAVAVGPLDMSFAVMLRIGDLTLAPPLGPGAEQVRVAYSFTQVEGFTPTVTHRSVRGHPRGDGGAQQQRFQRFAFNHQELFPAPTESSTWRQGGAGANRVFEVWGCSATGTESGSSGGPGQAEALLGLAKVSLRPFAAFEGRPGGSRLAVGADGPVSVVDPFSGKAVGALSLLLALGASPTIAALAGKGGDAEAGSDAAAPGGGSNAKGGKETREEKGDREPEDEGGVGLREGAAGGAEEEGGGDIAHAAEPPALDDSVAELSMLLNPGRLEGPKASPARSSGGFTGLVRHVVELSAVGELPVPVVLGDGITVGGEGAQEPVGCAIEYVLPSSQSGLDLDIDGTDTPPTNAGQTHELWWDADSGILNSRARHTVKVPGGILDKPAAAGSAGSAGDGAGQSGGDVGTGAVAATTEGGSLNNLLDCMFGREDVVLSIFGGVAAAGTGAGGGARPEAPWGHGGGGSAEESSATTKRQSERRSLIGKAVLRRADLLPLVRRTSARAVLRLPIEPADDTGEGVLLAAPEALPLSVSYRREPSAVARRKSRGRSGRREAPSEESRQGLDVSYDAEVAGLPSAAADPGKEAAEGGGECEASGVRGEDVSPGEVSLSWPPHGSHGSASAPEEGFGGSGDGGGSPDSCESVTGPLARRASRTEHLLPARTKLCVHVDSVRLTSDVGDMARKEQGLLLWVSFDFPGPESGGRPERKRGGVFVWKPGDEKEEKRREVEVQWSPAAVAARQDDGRDGRDGRDLVALLQWRLELPVTIDAAFVEFVNTQSLELRVWSGNREDWPAGGSPCGVAKVALRLLLTTPGGVGGDAAVITSGDGVDGGNVAARIFFKHRGLGPGDDGGKRRVELPGAGTRKADEEAAQGGVGARRRLPVSFREEVEVLGEERGGRTGAGSPAHGPAAGAEIAAATTTTTTTPRQASPDKSSLRTPSPPPSRGAPEERRAAARAASNSPSVVEEESKSNVLRVCVERAMRLEATPGAATTVSTVSGDPETAGCAAPPPAAAPPPSTYVTFRWEEEGKPPLRSPLVSGPSAASEEAGEGGVADSKEEAALTADGEVITPIVESSSNPVFNHVARLRLVDRDAWGRVCGPSAALVFRAWRRARCEWWEAAPRAPSNGGGGGGGGDAEHQPSFAPDEKGSTVAAGSRFGDKLIGAAVVGLEVLRGNVYAPDGLGLREIDGWYHVLDDMQRPRGQIKVRVCPQAPSSLTHLAPEPPPAFSEMPPGVGTGHDPLGLPVTLGPSPAAESSGTGNDGGVEDAPPSPPPLHDTQAHLRSVHALLDSLPDEFRSASRPRRPLPTSSAGREGIGLELPSLSEEPPAAAAATTTTTTTPSGSASPLVSPQYFGRTTSGAARQHGGCELTGGIPELRRMLSSLDKVDRRLFALGDDDDDDAQSSGGSSDVAGDVEYGSDGRGAGRGGPAVGGAPAINGSPSEANTGSPPADTDMSTARRRGTDHHLAVSRLQEAWRARSRRRREAAEAEAQRQAYALRLKRREGAAVAIQRAHRRAQARHRARAAAGERRRWEDRRRRRAAACAVLERAWRAFDLRRRAVREVAEARARAAAAVAAAVAAEAIARRSEQTVRGAVLIQAVWRGVSARAATARRIDASRARLRAAAAAAAPSGVLPAEREASPHRRVAGGIAVEPRPAPPSTFYNQLSQDPRRGHRLQLPEAHLAALPLSYGLPPRARSLAASSSAAVRDDGSRTEEARADTRPPPERLEPRRLARSAGAGRPPRFADQETARIARIMKGNLQHWASARSSSSSDELNL